MFSVSVFGFHYDTSRVEMSACVYDEKICISSCFVAATPSLALKVFTKDKPEILTSMHCFCCVFMCRSIS